MAPLVAWVVKRVVEAVVVQAIVSKLKQVEVPVDSIKGAVASKTMWFALLLTLAGLIEQYQGVLTSLIGDRKMGIVLMVVGFITAILRAVTGTTLAEKAPDRNEFN